ncbi:MATE family Na+-driven efflux transporter [Campylobacter sp. JMF_05 ED3]|uniref:MATE family Na+-driven efflux transporter n=1 Tax=Campylobacter sp. JMF_05 ED3 TaxID=2983838 RepID=UPI0022EA0C5A|nr:MATE family Na+-driven efflux transporter [Campylobacter sp. JMF_05 ED3]
MFGKSIKKQILEQAFTKKEYFLFLSLMIFSFIPSINQLVIDRLISSIGGNEFSIASQIEWFDLFNETILAFLTVPMYFVFNKAKDNIEMSSRINTTFIIAFILYLCISGVIYFYATNLISYMNAPKESIDYLKLETFGFIIGFISSYIYIIFVVKGKYEYFVTLLIIKVIMLSIGNILLIPNNGATGVAITNILVNFIISIVSIFLLYRENLIKSWTGINKEAIKDWFKTGIFSGMQVFIANLVYIAVVMKMVGQVSQMGNFWLANNFIWGWLLIPVMSMGEMIKREYYNGYKRIWNYIILAILIILLWLISIPLWKFMFEYIIKANEVDIILNIIYKSLPFYICYVFCVLIQSILISVGKTNYIFYECLIVNFIYYGVAYILVTKGIFLVSMDFIILLFGFGLIVSLIIDIYLYQYSKKHLLTNYN